MQAETSSGAHSQSGCGAAPGRRPGRPSAVLTYVELVHVKDRIERWIRFGRTAEEKVLSRRTRLVGFRPGDVFAFVRWQANDHGTVVSRIDILRAVRRGEACSTIPGVAPGAEHLLRLSGWPKVQRTLQAIDAVEVLGIDPADAAPDHWRCVHNRLVCGESPREYTPERHAAWLAWRELHA